MIDGKKIEFKLNGKQVWATPGETVIEVADREGVSIPRFCFHKHLSVAANCRMCLVEVVGVHKPLPACATTISEHMEIETRSTVTREAQKAIMEFLLINHPLDCPICDQGGECELQDVAMGFGQKNSDYFQGKRAVVDPDLGPLIATGMTRCIHCTRCVRFGDEIAGMPELGVMNRGESSAITTYLEHGVESELSGNMIDLCPVGALTSKPFRFQERSWTLQAHASISPHDCVGSHMMIHTTQRGEPDPDIVRVVPKENEAINQTWISDRDRFSYPSMQNNRLLTPKLKREGQWVECSWLEALTEIHSRLTVNRADDWSILMNPSSSSEEFYMAQKWLRTLGGAHIDHRLQAVNTAHQCFQPKTPCMPISFADLGECDAIWIIGGHPREEQPLLNHRIRQAVLKGAHVAVLHFDAQSSNYPLSIHHCVHPLSLVNELDLVLDAIDDKDNKKQELWGQTIECFKSSSRTAIIWGSAINTHPSCSEAYLRVVEISKKLNSHLIELTAGSNSAGGWLYGAIPHRLPGGQKINNPGRSTIEQLSSKQQSYWLHGIDPHYDLPLDHQSKKSLKNAFIVGVHTHETQSLKEMADVLLPLATYTESSGEWINAMGTSQIFNPVRLPLGQAKTGWKIYRVLGNQYGLPGFDQMDLNEVREEMSENCASSFIQEKMPEKQKIPVSTSNKAVYVLRKSFYLVDEYCRQSPPLVSASTKNSIAYVNEVTLASWALHTEKQHTITFDGQKRKVAIAVNAQLADHVMVIDLNIQDLQGFGSKIGSWQLERTDD